MKYDIFISYSRKDSAVVQSVVDRLKAEGYNCWMDVNGIESSDEFKRVLVKAIRKSRVFLFFASESSNMSEWTVKEVNVAVQLKKPIIPIRLDVSPYDDSVMFDLSSLDYIELKGTNFEDSLSRLFRGVSHCLRMGISGWSRGNAANHSEKSRTTRKTMQILLIAFAIVVFVGCVFGGFLYFSHLSKFSKVRLALPESPLHQEVATIVLPGDVPLDMIYVAPGEFMMGSENGFPNEKPVHKVKITKGFWMGKCEVTQRQWYSLMSTNPSHFKGDDNPVENVSWTDATNFCWKLNKLAKDTGVRDSQCKFRLPTEAEWEYACRAGTNGDYAGNVEEMCWHMQNCGGSTHPVGTKNANAWGFLDMHGNVCEWCNDYFDVTYYENSKERDPCGSPSGIGRVVRGGGVSCLKNVCRAATRGGAFEEQRSRDAGFRICFSTENGRCPHVKGEGQTLILPEKPTLRDCISVAITERTDMDFVYVAPGTFIMGDDNGRDDERPAHEVKISTGFWIGKIEVTQRQWREVMGTRKVNGAANEKGWERLLEAGFGLSRDGDKDYYPAEAVSWEDATNFCAKLTARERMRGRLCTEYAYRLPYEAEWEYACIAEERTTNTNLLEKMTWHRDNSDKKLHVCGRKNPNAWGLYDMNGNVSEWCIDWYDEEYYAKSPKTDPQGSLSGRFRVARGGSIKDGILDCVGTRRKKDSPSSYLSRFGFRVVLAPCIKEGKQCP